MPATTQNIAVIRIAAEVAAIVTPRLDLGDGDRNIAHGIPPDTSWRNR